ncbi:MAG: hypothetical protein GYB42_13765 [Alphaproteobacteria bacterium]|nr:hypothetical protein [Alphaproteobacteria bacterium]
MTVDPATLTSGADQAYFEGLMKGEVRLQSCKGCGKYHWPAVFHCPDCGSWEQVWKPVSPKGTIYSWTRTWHSFGGLEGFETPFASVVVTLQDVPSVRLLGLLQGDEAALAIGARVTGAVHSVEFQGRKIPALSWSLV